MIRILDACSRNTLVLYPILHANETKRTRRTKCSMSGRLAEAVNSYSHLISAHKGRHLLPLLMFVSSSFRGAAILYFILPYPYRLLGQYYGIGITYTVLHSTWCIISIQLIVVIIAVIIFLLSLFSVFHQALRALKHALQPAVEDISVNWDLPRGLSAKTLSPEQTVLYKGQRLIVYAQLTGTMPVSSNSCLFL